MASKALCVGINRYPGCPLNGCVNDVMSMAQMLVERDYFSAEQIRVIADERATTEEIFDRLTWLTSDVQPGDRILFHYSGHGAQIATRNPDDEIDGLDEVICPVDFDWSDEHLLRDKDLVKIFRRLPAGVRFNWLSDSCHSGDLTRGMPRVNTQAAGTPGPRFIPRCYPLEAGMSWRLQVAKAKQLAVHNEKPVLGVGFISGCKSDQTSADAYIDGKSCGAMTTAFLRELPKNPDAPLSLVAAGMRVWLKEGGYEQQPQAEGLRQNVAFLQ